MAASTSRQGAAACPDARDIRRADASAGRGREGIAQPLPAPGAASNPESAPAGARSLTRVQQARPVPSRSGRACPVVARHPLPEALPFSAGDPVSAPFPWWGRLSTWIMAIVWTDAGFAARCAGLKKPVPLADLKRRRAGK